MAAEPLEVPVLSDGVVRLRPFAADDAPALAEIWSDPEIRTRNEVPAPTEAAARRWVEAAAARSVAGEAWEWAILAAGTGELAGRRALKEIDWERGRALAASWVGPRFRGRRFAARSLRLAGAHAFAHGLARIDAECEADNEAALRSMAAAGMRPTGTGNAVSSAGDPVELRVLTMLPGDLADPPLLL